MEARWAVFFDALGIEWRYEPEGFIMQFDYEEFALGWDMSEEELLSKGVPQTFKHLDGKEYLYLPDFYLPELNYWVEIKGPNPTKEEVEKAFILDYMLRNETRSKLRTAKTEADELKAFKDLSTEVFLYSTVIFHIRIPRKATSLGTVFILTYLSSKESPSKHHFRIGPCSWDDSTYAGRNVRYAQR